MTRVTHLAFVAVATLGCRGDPAATRAAGSSERAGEARPVDVPGGRNAAPKDLLGVELLVPGAEPRRLLRHRFAAGTRTTLRVEVDLDRTGPTGTGPLPTFVTTLELRVTAVAPDGTASLRTTVTSSGTVAREGSTVLPEHVAGQAALLEGAVITSTIAPDGTTGDVAITLPSRDAPPELVAEAKAQLATVGRLALRLPAEPIGVGGRWRHAVPATPNGIAMIARTETEVVALEGERVTYRLVTTLAGADQLLEAPGVKLAISNLRGSGTGTGNFDLTTWIGTSTATQQLDFDMTAEGERASSMLRMTVRTQGEQSAP